jgi:hypothetical protein
VIPLKKSISEYKSKLEKEIVDYMSRVPPSERSANAVKGMWECWEELDEVEKKLDKEYAFDATTAKSWVEAMENEDGTHGEHWTIEETTGVAQSHGINFNSGITEYCWWVTMNMLYSDYFHVARKYGVATADFFGDMAKAFLYDKDAGTPREKITGYYYGVVKKH